jgi:hypothetical protein
MSEYTSKEYDNLIHKVKNKKAPYDKRPANVDLQNIIIDKNPLLFDKHINLLVDALSKNKNIASLNLKGVKISYPAVETLKNHVQNNVYLHNVHIECMFTEEGRKNLEEDLMQEIKENNQKINDLCDNDKLMYSKKNNLLGRSIAGLKSELEKIKKINAKSQKDLKSLSSIYSKIKIFFFKKRIPEQKNIRRELQHDIQFMNQFILIINLLIKNKEKQEYIEKINAYQQNINKIIMQGRENQEKSQESSIDLIISEY